MLTNLRAVDTYAFFFGTPSLSILHKTYKSWRITNIWIGKLRGRDVGTIANKGQGPLETHAAMQM